MDESKEEDDITFQIKKLEEERFLGNFSQFLYKRTLSDNRETKTTVVEGSFKGTAGTALLILEKESFVEEELKTIFQEENQIEKSFKNDIYYSCMYYPKSAFNGIKVTLIYPATEKHIAKYQDLPVHIIEETSELYLNVTLPFLINEQFSLQWVYNILEHKSETDRIIFEDPDPDTGFILCSDLKWNGKSVETLYLLALPFKKGIMSLRDLTEKDLPLLRNIYNKGLKAIEDKYSIPRTRLLVYIHYQPSFYHFHIHFTNLQYLAPGSGTHRAHLVTTVINNLELMSNYYKISKLDFAIKESDKLFAKYESAGLVKRSLNS